MGALQMQSPSENEAETNAGAFFQETSGEIRLVKERSCQKPGFLSIFAFTKKVFKVRTLLKTSQKGPFDHILQLFLKNSKRNTTFFKKKTPPGSSFLRWKRSEVPQRRTLGGEVASSQ